MALVNLGILLGVCLYVLNHVKVLDSMGWDGKEKKKSMAVFAMGGMVRGISASSRSMWNGKY